MSHARRYRLEDLRDWAVRVARGAGVRAADAAALAHQLQWFEIAGRPAFGYATLPAWLAAPASERSTDHAHTGLVVREMAGVTIFDARGGIGPARLREAAEIALQKSREFGVGVVRVIRLGGMGPAAPVVAEVALGPAIALAWGPESLSFAVPSEAGPPLVFDDALAPEQPARHSGVRADLACLLAQGEWLLQVIDAATLDSLEGVQKRATAAAVSVAARGGEGRGGACWISPTDWDARRRKAIEEGIELPAQVWDALRTELGALALEPPEPLPRPRGQSSRA